MDEIPALLVLCFREVIHATIDPKVPRLSHYYGSILSHYIIAYSFPELLRQYSGTFTDTIFWFLPFHLSLFETTQQYL